MCSVYYSGTELAGMNSTLAPDGPLWQPRLLHVSRMNLRISLKPSDRAILIDLADNDLFFIFYFIFILFKTILLYPTLIYFPVQSLAPEGLRV